MRITLYFDEDAQDSDLIQALHLRGVGAVGAWEAGMRERKDEDQLLRAAAQRLTLYSFNVRDYCRLHAEFVSQSKPHQALSSPSNSITPSASKCAGCSNWLRPSRRRKWKTESSSSAIGRDWDSLWPGKSG